MRTYVLVLGLGWAVAGTTWANESDDTLQFFLSKAELVVVGTIEMDPFSLRTEIGISRNICDLRITEVIKGKKPNTDRIRVKILLFELDEDDGIPELKAGAKCILFLKPDKGDDFPAWETADFWFGWQRPSPSMVRSLKRLVAQAKANDKR